MIARALSPGLNDPHTAINCLNWLAAGLAAGSEHGTAFGIEGTERVVIQPIDIDTLVQATFGVTRPYVESDDMTFSHWNVLLDDLSTLHGGRLAEAINAMRTDSQGHSTSR